MRTKQDYVLSEKNGKMVPEKVGLKTVQRDGMDYEFTLVFDLDIKHNATASKDRTGLFAGKPEQKLGVQTGKLIQEWCNVGTVISTEELLQLINACKTVPELRELYHLHPTHKEKMLPFFEARKKEILSDLDVNNHLLKLKIHQNGTDH
jgi:hypothetical protein